MQVAQQKIKHERVLVLSEFCLFVWLLYVLVYSQEVISRAGSQNFLADLFWITQAGCEK